MVDTQNTSADTGNVNTTSTGGVSGADLAQVIAQAVAAAVTTSMNEVTAKINQMQDSITEMTTKVSGATDSDSGYVVRSVIDPADDQHRMMLSRDQAANTAQQMMNNMVERCTALMDEYLKYTAGVWARSLDHFGSLPPVASRPSAGPTSG